MMPDMWVVTHTPKDMPQWPYVARLWKDGAPIDTVICTESLGEMRRTLRGYGCELCMDRAPDDDPVIVETWT